MACSNRVRAYRASIVHSVGDPSQVGIEASYQYYEDGLLVVSDGKIQALGHAHDLLPSLSHGTEVVHYQDALIAPGFIDAHIHFPQLEIVASYGHQLLDWLDNHVYPAEARFVDGAHASTIARRFLEELLRNGTTTALVFGSSHMDAVDAFFEAASELGLRIIAGKVLMDRNAPDSVTDTLESGCRDSAELIRRWHGKGRLSYAVTPRFAITCSGEQLRRAGELLAENPGVYLHTHLSENKKEIENVAEFFPEHLGYLNVYDHYKLVGPRSVFAHGVHLTDEECARLGQSGAAVAFCPTSNLFLGSGLLDLPRLEAHGVSVGLGTDVGAGTSFSLLQTLNEAYKVMQLQGHTLHPFKSLYLATLGGARALRLDDRIGSFAAGNEADFVVLDYKATPLIEDRIKGARNLEEKLFVLMMLGDDRCVKETFSAGKSVHKRSNRMHNPFGHHQPEPQQPYQAPHGGQYPPPIQGETVKIYCEANPDFLLASRNESVVMVPANESDPSQQWIMDTSWSVKAKDDAGFPAFALVNKATGQSLRHGRAEKDKVTLGPYHPDDLNEAVLFTQSADVGKGYQCIRPVNNTHLNLDASTGDDKHHVALSEGTEIILCKWNKKESQKWKISPILGSSHGAYPPRGEPSSFFPQANVEPQGSTVRIHCEANPEFFLAARGDVAVLAPENPRDPHQQWIKVDSWGLRVKDEAGFPAFALVNKATRHALKHGDKEWDQIYLADYNHDKAEQSVLWTLSADVGNGYQCLRPVNNINLNMDAKAADGHVGGIRDGNELILFEWKKQSNQKWKLQPVH